jgi:hypothetical protein
MGAQTGSQMPHIHIVRKLLRPQRFLDCLLFVIFSLVQVVGVVPEPAAAGGDVGGVGAEQSEHSVPGSLQSLHQRALNDLSRARLSWRSYNLAPRQPPLPSENCLSFSVFSCVAGPAYLREGGGRGGRGAESNCSAQVGQNRMTPS